MGLFILYKQVVPMAHIQATICIATHTIRYIDWCGARLAGNIAPVMAAITALNFYVSDETPCSILQGYFAGGKLAKVRKLLNPLPATIVSSGVVNIFFGAYNAINQRLTWPVLLQYARLVSTPQNALQPHCLRAVRLYSSPPGGWYRYGYGRCCFRCQSTGIRAR